MIERKNMAAPEEVRTFEGGRMEIVWLAGTTVVRGTFEPGFRWSQSLKEKAGTDSCQLAHRGFLSSGRLGVAADDGDEIELVAGDVYNIPPGHDTWVVGDEAAVLLDFTGDDHLFRMLEWSG